MSGKYTYGQDREMMLDPDEWPYWPWLPVKRGNWLHTDDGLGVMVEASDVVRPTVYIANLCSLAMGASLRDAPKKEYETIDELLADGWLVD